MTQQTCTEPNTCSYDQPLADICESDSEFLLYIELPGLEPGNIELDIHDEALTIKGHTQQQESSQKALHSGFRPKNYARTFSLSRKIDSEQISAEFNNGLLKVHLPKRQPRSLKIQVS